MPGTHLNLDNIPEHNLSQEEMSLQQEVGTKQHSVKNYKLDTIQEQSH